LQKTFSYLGFRGSYDHDPVVGDFWVEDSELVGSQLLPDFPSGAKNRGFRGERGILGIG
jgi:hypothetical protein